MTTYFMLKCLMFIFLTIFNAYIYVVVNGEYKNKVYRWKIFFIPPLSILICLFVFFKQQIEEANEILK